jgi:hypothetical protein
MARRLAERRVQDRVIDHDRWQAVPLHVAGRRCLPGYASGGPVLGSSAPRQSLDPWVPLERTIPVLGDLRSS